MREKDREQDEESKKPENAEKPVSLAGASFLDVLKALLDTKPKPQEEKGRAKNDD